MESNLKPRTVLLGLLAACVVSTAIHYTDNTISYDKYPQSDTVTAGVIALSWLLITPAAILGYRLYVGGKMLPAYVSLAVFSLVGLSTPWHYTSQGFSDFALLRNISILTDGVTGAAVLLFVLWSALIAREWERSASPRQPSAGSPAG